MPMGENGERDVTVMLGEPHRAILSMVGPVFIALLIGQVNTLVDTMWCSGLGVDALSAISLVSGLYFILVGIGNGIGVGANVAISRRIGAGDRDGAEKCAAQTLIVMVLVSLPIIPFMFLIMEPLVHLMGGDEILRECDDYLTPLFALCTFTILTGVISGVLRGEGATRLSTFINLCGAIVNIVLDPIFIFVLDMGLFGASMATSISAIVSVVLGLWVFSTDMTYLRIRRSGLERSILSDVFYVGIPQMAELNIMGVLNLFLITLVLTCGGTDGLAVYGAPFRFINLVMVPANAIAVAMVPVCSSAIGQGDRERLRSAYYYTVKLTIAVGLLLTVVIFALADPLMISFSYSSDMSGYKAEMAHALRIYVLSLALYGFIYVGSSMLSSLRKSGYALVSSFLRNMLLICLYYVSTFHDMDWIYWSFTIGEIVGGAFMLGLAQWQFRKRYAAMGQAPPACAS